MSKHKNPLLQKKVLIPAGIVAAGIIIVGALYASGNLFQGALRFTTTEKPVLQVTEQEQPGVIMLETKLEPLTITACRPELTPIENTEKGVSSNWIVSFTGGDSLQPYGIELVSETGTVQLKRYPAHQPDTEIIFTVDYGPTVTGDTPTLNMDNGNDNQTSIKCDPLDISQLLDNTENTTSQLPGTRYDSTDEEQYQPAPVKETVVSEKTEEEPYVPVQEVAYTVETDDSTTDTTTDTSSSTGNSTESAPVTITNTDYCAEFTDVTKQDIDCPAFTYAKSIGALTGNDDGTLRPWDFLQRDQFAKVIVQALYNYSNSTDYANNRSPFPDVTDEDWSYQYVAYAKQLDIITGYLGGEDKGYYRPERIMTRAEFLTILLRAVEDLGIDDMPSASLQAYADTQTNDWYSAYAKYSKDADLFTGEYLYPFRSVTRREVAQTLYKLHLQHILE